MELAIRGLLQDGGYAGFTFHFDSFGGDGRFRQLPLLAASNLMADGYGFAAEGDVNTAALMCAAHVLSGDGGRTSPSCTRWIGSLTRCSSVTWARATGGSPGATGRSG